jgi:hypothetical protein
MDTIATEQNTSADHINIQGPDVVQKQADPTITIGTLARALEALARNESDPVGLGADHYQDTFKIRPLTEQGRLERQAQIEAKKQPLRETLNGMSKVLTAPLKLHDLLNDDNQYVFEVPFNGKSTTLSITPSSLTKSIDIEIPGEGSRNVAIGMKTLLIQLGNHFPVSPSSDPDIQMT